MRGFKPENEQLCSSGVESMVLAFAIYVPVSSVGSQVWMDLDLVRDVHGRYLSALPHEATLVLD
jgi:hypothetical protein